MFRQLNERIEKVLYEFDVAKEKAKLDSITPEDVPEDFSKMNEIKEKLEKELEGTQIYLDLLVDDTDEDDEFYWIDATILSKEERKDIESELNKLPELYNKGFFGDCYYFTVTLDKDATEKQINTAVNSLKKAKELLG